MLQLAEVRIGTSGYVYPHWRKGVVYPSDLAVRQELTYYAARFRTVELNSPFYRLPRRRCSFAGGRAPRATLTLRSRRAATSPTSSGCTTLPTRLRSSWNGRPCWDRSSVRCCFSFRQLSRSIPRDWGTFHITTAPFTYIRMHRGQEPAGGFTKEELKSWAAQVRALAASGRQVYIYFNNDWEGLALRDVVTFERLLGLEDSTRAADVHPQDDRVLPGLTIPPTR